MRSEPLVSCIMPTRGRQRWATDAVRMFNEQTYSRRELVIIDDRMDPSFPRGLSAALVKYSVSPRVTLGEKRNIAVSRASGEIIMHWDSDDVYRNDRIEHQVSMLIESDADLVGYNTMRFERVEDGAFLLYRGAPGYPIGVSFCYWRDIWDQRKYPVENVGEDEGFKDGCRIVTCDAGDRIVARLHGGNTCDKTQAIRDNPHQWVPLSPECFA